MLGEEVQRDTITFNIAISACEKGGQWKQALAPSRRMRCERVQQNTITYRAAISDCEKGGQWQKALELFERMLGECVCNESLSLTVLPSAFARKAGCGRRPWSSSKE